MLGVDFQIVDHDGYDEFVEDITRIQIDCVNNDCKPAVSSFDFGVIFTCFLVVD